MKLNYFILIKIYLYFFYQIDDPREQFVTKDQNESQKEQMIANFISIVKNNSQKSPSSPIRHEPIRSRKESSPDCPPVDEMQMLKIEIDRSKERVERLRFNFY